MITCVKNSTFVHRAGMLFRAYVFTIGLLLTLPALVRADFIFTDFSNVSSLTLNGSAAQVGNILRLTPDTVGLNGSAWHTSSKAHVADGFDTTFTFRMWNGDGGDGFAFVIQDESAIALGSGGSDLGYGNGITQSLAIEFDTFNFFPETDNHISVQTRGANGNSAEDQYSIGQVNMPSDLNDGNPHTVTIRYRPGVLLVFFDSGGAPVLDISVDLQNISGDNILDGSGDAWVGFTAGTGAATQKHDILSWDFDENNGSLPTGACCTVSGCVISTAYSCATQLSGFYSGDNVDCESVKCSGACCTATDCEISELAECVNFGGTFRGVGVTCDGNVCDGACCDPNGICFITTFSDCVDNLSGTFHGAGTSCGPFPCTLPNNGACCIDQECLLRTEEDCASESGVWFGAGTSCLDVNCNDAPPPFGACCQPDGGCHFTAQAACEHFNGIYAGDAVSCGKADCTPAGTGACCVNGNCTETVQSDCQAQGGYFQGVDVLCSNPNLQCSDLGLCCFIDGSCATTSVDFCFNDLSGPLFSTPGTCDTTTCSQYGACCNASGDCTETWEFECNSSGLTFHGQGSTCSENFCATHCICRGDINGDGLVNGRDVQQFVTCYVASFGGPPTISCGCADVADDDVIGAADVTAMVGALLNGDGCP